MSIDFDYSLGDKVRITEIQISGHVVGLFYGESGKQYQVAYFVDGEMKTVFIYGFQLESATKNNQIGF